MARCLPKTKKNQHDMHSSASRIDFALCSKGWDTNITNITYLPGVMTDHCAVFCAFKVNKNERGVGYWKVNNTILSQVDFIQLITDAVNGLNLYQYANPLEKWERIKNTIRSTAQQYSRRKASMDSLIISQLMEKIDEYQCQFPLDKINTELWGSVCDRTRTKTTRSNK